MPHYVVEHKTSSETIAPGSVYWRKLLIDAQVDFYLPGADHIGKACDGVLYDVLGKPQLRPKRATPPEDRKYTKPTKAEPVPRLYANQRLIDETPEEYEARCLAKITSAPERFYQRATIVRLSGEKTEAAFDVWQTAGSIRDAKRLKVFPRNPDACVQWGRACDFFPVCVGMRDISDPLFYRVNEFEHTELGARGEGLLTQSSIRCYRACPRRYYYRYVMRVRALSDEAAPLRLGTLVHLALESWWKTGGNLPLALGQLDVSTDPYERAKMRAMMIGYHARWEAPPPCEHVELFIRTPLINPETGAASRTFELGMKLDVLAELEHSMEIPLLPVAGQAEESLESLLEASIKQLED